MGILEGNWSRSQCDNNKVMQGLKQFEEVTHGGRIENERNKRRGEGPI